MQKVIKGGGNRALILRSLASPMIKVSLEDIYLFQFWPSLEVAGFRVGPKVETFCPSCSRKNSNFSKVF